MTAACRQARSGDDPPERSERRESDSTLSDACGATNDSSDLGQIGVRALLSAADTRAFGVGLASVLRAGDLVVLNGPLGAGKTVLVQGIGAGLGVRGNIVSPTFVIARVHRPGASGGLPLVHVDAYRLGSLEEVDDLDLDVSIDDAVTVVEWGAGKVEQLVDARLQIELSRAPDSEERTLRLFAFGGGWTDRIAALLAD